MFFSNPLFLGGVNILYHKMFDLLVTYRWTVRKMSGSKTSNDQKLTKNEDTAKKMTSITGVH
jgi:hypothetical protein